MNLARADLVEDLLVYLVLLLRAYALLAHRSLNCDIEGGQSVSRSGCPKCLGRVSQGTYKGPYFGQRSMCGSVVIMDSVNRNGIA